MRVAFCKSLIDRSRNEFEKSSVIKLRFQLGEHNVLYKHKLIETGNGTLTVSSELEPCPCACGKESIVNLCKACRKTHHHGHVHLKGDLVPLCKDCGERQ